MGVSAVSTPQNQTFVELEVIYYQNWHNGTKKISHKARFLFIINFFL